MPVTGIQAGRSGERAGVSPDMPARGAGAAATPLALVLETLSVGFGGLQVLDGVSMTIRPAERHAVFGPNGAGKTTLFNLIGGDLMPGGGRILFFDMDVTRLPPHARVRLGMRRTYQSSMLFPELSVLENLLIAVRGVRPGRFGLGRIRPGDVDVEAAETLLRNVRLTDVAAQTVATLSHGQQRQLEIGMALAGTPRLILLDEPAAGLSAAERRDLGELLTALPRSTAFLLIEHDLEIALQVADRVSVMHGGRVMRQGTPDEIMNDAEVQAIYLGGGSKEAGGHAR
ncbi:ABC transporter ATP-binding protein [Vineibacter terrae]|uniref:ABC transporter ATP-binding protein n=1 Tax=Vineibacter terrae TaxID=2586908 RepID=UPI0039C9D92A